MVNFMIHHHQSLIMIMMPNIAIPLSSWLIIGSLGPRYVNVAPVRPGLGNPAVVVVVLPVEIKCFSTRNIPIFFMEESFKRCSIPLEQGHFCSIMIGNNPAPYVACFLNCSDCFSMQNLCQKVQCINTLFPENPVRMTILLTNGSYSIREYGIIWIKETMFQQK